MSNFDRNYGDAQYGTIARAEWFGAIRGIPWRRYWLVFSTLKGR